MSRIVAGAARGRQIRTPPGRSTRPTSDRVREALFSSLEVSLGSFAGVRFLDLYAGSGAVGLEAASRGAAHATLVEQHPRTAALARRNAADLGLRSVDVVTAKVERFAAQPAATPFEAVFLDPPYDVDNATVAGVLHQLADQGWIADAAVAVVERSTRSPELAWPDRYAAERQRTYGETALWYGRAAGPSRRRQGG